MKMSLRSGAATAAFAMAACGAGGGPDGGGSNLPNRGIAPWTRVGNDAILAPPTNTTWARPSAIADESAITVYFQATTAEYGEIRRATAGLDGEVFGESETVLVEATQPGATHGPDGTPWLAWVDTDGHVHIGTVDAGGQVDEVIDTNIVGTSPSIVFGPDGRLNLFVVSDGAVRHQAEGDDGDFGDATTVFEPGVDCLNNDNEPADCWDATAIADIDVDLATTAAGRHIWRMFYTGRRNTNHAVGFAASFDGLNWQRYLFNPVLASGANARAPTAIIAGPRYLLFAEDRPSRGIALHALTPQTQSERW